MVTTRDWDVYTDLQESKTRRLVYVRNHEKLLERGRIRVQL